MEIVQADALTLDEQLLLRDERVRVAANLPYNVGTALLVKWLTAEAWPPFWQSLTLMFQRESRRAHRRKAGHQCYGRLSVLSQWRTAPKILFDVARQAFTPPPKITSAIVRFEPLAEPVAPCELHDLEKVTEAAFGQRRKMLRQSLKQIAPMRRCCSRPPVSIRPDAPKHCLSLSSQR
ncbi:MAG: rRNA adenine dimethyltransferase family protein [Rhizomicrobium sp.]